MVESLDTAEIEGRKNSRHASLNRCDGEVRGVLDGGEPDAHERAVDGAAADVGELAAPQEQEREEPGCLHELFDEGSANKSCQTSTRDGLHEIVDDQGQRRSDAGSPEQHRERDGPGFSGDRDQQQRPA